MVTAATPKVLTTALLAFALAACGGETPVDSGGDAAAAGEPAIIAERQTNFEEIGDAFKAIRGEFEGDTPDLAVVGAQAQIINANAQKIGDHFPEGTGMDAGYDTEALASIWEKPDDFKAAHEKLVATSTALVEAAASGDASAAQAQVGEVGKSCKACHDQFRVDDE